MRCEVGNGSVLGPDEPPAFQIVREQGRSAYLLTCDHGGNLLPRALGHFGLEPNRFARHIAWDIGAAALARNSPKRSTLF